MAKKVFSSLRMHNMGRSADCSCFKSSLVEVLSEDKKVKLRMLTLGK